MTAPPRDPTAPAPRVLALFGPTGVGKTALALALADRLRARGHEPVAVSADALQVYAGLETLTGVASADQRERLEHRMVGIVPVTQTFSAGRYAELAHAEIDAILAAGATPIVVGGTGLYLRAALAHLDLRPEPPPALRAEFQQRLDAEGSQALHAELVERAPEAAGRVRPTDAHRIVRLLELHAMGEAPPERGAGSQLWTTDTRHPTRLLACTMDREALYARIDARVRAMIAAGAREEVERAAAAGASPTARKALGFQELLDGDEEAMARRTRQYARRQLTWLRKLEGVEHIDLTGRDPEAVAAELLRSLRPTMRFEKWQALGNDYLIVERAALPWALNPERVRRLCDRHYGLGGDGLLQLEPPDEPGFVARLRIFNPDGSEAELSGNGAREAILYLRARGWTAQDQFSIQTVAGEIRPTITSPTTCSVDMGRARLTSEAYPDGPRDGGGEVAGFRFQHVHIGNPQCAIRVADEAALEALDLPAIGPAIEHDPRFPQRTNVSWWCALAEPGRIRARIFERGVGETESSGTGATGAAVAAALQGLDAPVTVVLDGGELTVDVDESLHVDLAGWAVPVYAGEVAPALLADLADL